MLPHQPLWGCDLVGFCTAHIVQNLEDSSFHEYNNQGHCCLPSTAGRGNGGDALDWYWTNSTVLDSRNPCLTEYWIGCIVMLFLSQRLYSMLWRERDTENKILFWEGFQNVGDEFLFPRLWCRKEDAVSVSVSVCLLYWHVQERFRVLNWREIYSSA